MINKNDARAILYHFLAKRYPNRQGDAEIVINDDIAERDYGWLFTYTTAVFRRTRDPRKTLIGAGPALVLRNDGSIVKFPSFYSPEQALSKYENYPHKFSSLKDG